MAVHLHDFDGEHSLTLDVGGLAADAAVVAAGHEPNGYFWEGLVRFAWPDIAEHLDFDSEADMLCAVGSPSDLARLKSAVESLITNPAAVRDVIARAETAGFAYQAGFGRDRSWGTGLRPGYRTFESRLGSSDPTHPQHLIRQHPPRRPGYRCHVIGTTCSYAARACLFNGLHKRTLNFQIIAHDGSVMIW